MSSFSETADAEITASALQSVCSTYIESRLLRTLLNRSRGCQTLINLWRAASSRTHHVDEINPLGIEIWYRTTRRHSILDGIEAIRLVPKKYRTRYPALLKASSDLIPLKWMFNLSEYIVINIWEIIVVSDCINLYRVIVNVKRANGRRWTKQQNNKDKEG